MGKLTQSYPYEDILTHCFHIIFDINDEGAIYQAEDEWCDEIFDEIPNFALGKQKAQEISKDSPRKATKQGMKLLYQIKEIQEANLIYLNEIEDIKIEDKYLNRGEFGELILYYLLDKKLDKPQLISKIYFKDSYNSVVHGFDSVHFDKNTNELWLGESKFYKNKNSALTELAKDLSDHFNVDFFKQEFTIINNRFNDVGIENNEIKELIDPDTRFLSKLTKINACFFALFDSNVLNSFTYEKGTDYPSKTFLKNIEELVIDTRNSFDKKIMSYQNSENLKIYLFLFPVSSKHNLVKKLHQKLKKEQN